MSNNLFNRGLLLFNYILQANSTFLFVKHHIHWWIQATNTARCTQGSSVQGFLCVLKTSHPYFFDLMETSKALLQKAC